MSKIDILKNDGFKEHFDRDIYYNKKYKIVFCLEAIEDHDEKWLKEKIEEGKNPKDWPFYCNDCLMTDEKKKEIISDITK